MKNKLFILISIIAFSSCKKNEINNLPQQERIATVKFEVVTESNFVFSLLGAHPGPNTLTYSLTDQKPIEPLFSIFNGIGSWSTSIIVKDVKKGEKLSLKGSIMVEDPGFNVRSKIYVDNKVVAESVKLTTKSSYGGEAVINLSYTFDQF